MITKFTHMDDSSGSASSQEVLDETISQITKLLPYGGFKLKVTTKSGCQPQEKASADGKTVTFAGYRWASKDDEIMLGGGEINFNAKRRGVKKPNTNPVESDEDVQKLAESVKLTKRKLLGKTLEVFDIVGLFEPLKARLRIDMQPLKHLDYDDEIPTAMKQRWIENLKMINQSRTLFCKRAIVPKDAEDPASMEIIVCS